MFAKAPRFPTLTHCHSSHERKCERPLSSSSVSETELSIVPRERSVVDDLSSYPWLSDKEWEKQRNYIITLIVVYLEYKIKKSRLFKRKETPFDSAKPEKSVTTYLFSILHVVSIPIFSLFGMLSLIDEIEKNIPGETINSFNARSLIGLSLMVAMDFIEDGGKSQSFFAKLGKLSIKEFNRLHADFLTRLDWRIAELLHPQRIYIYLKLLLIHGLESLPKFNEMLNESELTRLNYKSKKSLPLELYFKLGQFERFSLEDKPSAPEICYDPKQDRALHSAKSFVLFKMITGVQRRMDREYSPPVKIDYKNT